MIIDKNKLLILVIIIFFNYFIKINFRSTNKNVSFFFFEYEQEELKYCTNYGLMVYNYYYNGKINYVNIGDYIQSLAALQYLPKNCKPYFVDRDIIRFYDGPKVKLIMNSWNLLHEGNIYPSEQIKPFYISYNFIPNGKVITDFVNKIKQYSPIGCRDLKSRDILIKKGINAYFSSCLTTTLDIDYGKKEKERTKEIIFTDYKFGDYKSADKFILSLKAYNYNRITHLSHYFKNNITHLDRFKLAKKLLDKYSKAKLVVTTRIHAALPCLSFNTPVIFINKKYKHNRYPGLYELLNTIGHNKLNKFEINVNIDNKGYVYNPKKYLYYSKKLKLFLKDF